MYIYYIYTYYIYIYIYIYYIYYIYTRFFSNQRFFQLSLNVALSFKCCLGVAHTYLR